jgi:hypothetical protein
MCIAHLVEFLKISNVFQSCASEDPTNSVTSRHTLKCSSDACQTPTALRLTNTKDSALATPDTKMSPPQPASPLSVHPVICKAVSPVPLNATLLVCLTSVLEILEFVPADPTPSWTGIWVNVSRESESLVNPHNIPAFLTQPAPGLSTKSINVNAVPDTP